MEEEEMITLFESMSQEEQDSMAPEELEYISKIVERRMSDPYSATRASERNTENGSSTEPSLYRKYATVQPYRPDVNTTEGNITDMTQKLAMLPLEGFGLVPGVKAVVAGLQGKDPIEHRTGADMLVDYTNSLTQGVSKAADVHSAPKDQRAGIAKQHDDALMNEPQTMLMTPGPSGLVANMALNAGLGALSDTEDPVRGGTIGLGAGVGLPVLAKGLGKLTSSQSLNKMGVMNQNPGILKKSSDYMLGRFTGMDPKTMAEKRANGTLDPLFQDLEDLGVLEPGIGRQEAFNQAEAMSQDFVGPRVGSVVDDLPNAYNNDVSQSFNSAAKNQEMTGVQERFAKGDLQYEADRWANKPGMVDDSIEVGQSNQWVPDEVAGTNLNPDEQALADVNGQFSSEPVPGSGMMVDPTAGNPIEGVDPSLTWVNKDPIAGTGMVVPQNTASQIHRERVAIDDELYKSTLPGASAVQTQAAPGLQARREVYDQELHRRAVQAGRAKDLESAERMFGNVSEAKRGLGDELKRGLKYEEMNKNLGVLTAPIRHGVEHGMSFVGLGARDLAKAMEAWAQGTGANKVTPKMSRIITMIAASEQPEVDRYIAIETDEEYNRLEKEFKGMEE